MHKQQVKRIIRYIILYNIIWGISIAMCYLDCVIDNISYTVQAFLIDFFFFFFFIVIIIGAIRTLPQESYSNKRIWFYYAIMGGSLAAIKHLVKLIEILNR